MTFYQFFLENIRVMGRIIRLGFQFLYGLWRFSALKPPIVSVFGGKNVVDDSEYGKKAYELSRLLTQHNISIVTGGGPGIMKAANCGALDASLNGKNNDLHTFGVGVRGVDEQEHNECAPMITVDYMFVRKWFLIQYARGFVLFPGGVGTMDELFEVLNLMKLNKIKRVPVILIGADYWKKIDEWYTDYAIKQGMVLQQYRDLFEITDDITYAVDVLKKACGK